VKFKDVYGAKTMGQQCLFIKQQPVKVPCVKKIRVVHEKNPLTDLEPSD